MKVRKKVEGRKKKMVDFDRIASLTAETALITRLLGDMHDGTVGVTIYSHPGVTVYVDSGAVVTMLMSERLRRLKELKELGVNIEGFDNDNS